MDYQESYENLQHYNLFELMQESTRLNIPNTETLSKDELIMGIMQIMAVISSKLLKNIISQLMRNDKNGTWYTVKTIENLKECLLASLEDYEEGEETYLFYKEMLDLIY